jgi:hypothetical protein
MEIKMEKGTPMDFVTDLHLEIVMETKTRKVTAMGSQMVKETVKDLEKGRGRGMGKDSESARDSSWHLAID